MKKLINQIQEKMYRIQWLAFLLVTLVPLTSMGQDDSTAAEEPETISPLISFSSVQKSNQTIDLKGTFKAKINGTLTKLEGLKVEFFAVGAEDIKLGEAVTDKNGLAVVNTKAEGLVADTAGMLNFKVSYAGNAKMDAAEDELAIKKARLEITPVKADSVLTLQAKLIDLSTGTETPVPETELGIFVKRLFNPLKIGEGTTDENGEASIEVPSKLPGDVKGNLTLMARVVDHETYGNIETSVVQPWGVAVSEEMKGHPRALWSPHPPMWMLITFVILMGTVWGHYIVIVYELVRLKGEH